MDKTAWATLSVIDVSQHTENKNGFTYLSWAWAWATLKQHYPKSTFTKHTDFKGIPYFMDEAGYAYVKVSVGLGVPDEPTVTETFPVLNHANKPINKPSSFEVNTALQRCLAKAISYHGLGAYIYAGEDLPPTVVEATIKTATDPEKSEHGKTSEIVAEIFIKFLPDHTTVESLRSFWTLNLEAINYLKRDKPSEYERVLGQFNKRKKELEPKEK